jgi:pimeloyl-ACP methyl ester carboxylesterase
VIPANAGVPSGIDIKLEDDVPFRRWYHYALDWARFCPASWSPGRPRSIPPGMCRSAPTTHRCPAKSTAPALGCFPNSSCSVPPTPPRLCQDTRRRLAEFDKPFLFVLGEHEESFNALAPVLQGTIPGAAGQPHTTIPAAGHFFQEHVPDILNGIDQ